MAYSDPRSQRTHKPASTGRKTSWEGSSKRYDGLVGEKGHSYHQTVVLPGLLRLMALSKTENPSVLDLACGQGVLARNLPRGVKYEGYDVSQNLITSAQAASKEKNHHFDVADVTLPLPTKTTGFTHATIVLALQNIADPGAVMQNAAKHLGKGGKLLIVLNHPCFRIPRQSSWDINEANKMQSRKVARYMTQMEIPIQMEPSKGAESAVTYSYHMPLSDYFLLLSKHGFVVEGLEEWCSDKASEGKYRAMEDRARNEIPMFMTLVARLV